MSIHLNLPYPPSVNHYWRFGQGRFYISEAGTKYRKRVYERVLEQLKLPLPRLSGRLEVTLNVYPPDERTRDLDNLNKGVWDALVYAQVILDDGLIDRIHVLRCPITRGGHVVVRIDEIPST